MLTRPVLGLCEYSLCFYYFIVRNGKYSNCHLFINFNDELSKRIKVHLFFLNLHYKLWNQQHYRAGSFQQDAIKNLRNVSLPGIPFSLKYIFYQKFYTLLFLLVFYPLLAMCSALKLTLYEYKRQKKKSFKQLFRTFDDSFLQLLLYPSNWFVFWRTNCALSSWHFSVTKSDSYRFEDKWLFIDVASKHNIPVSPIFSKIHSIVCKDRNEEGGMGIQFFDNVTNGGKWIIQKRLHNSKFMSSLLPKTAPLSTFRVVTISEYSLPNISSDEAVRPISCVLRAGHAYSSTDHECTMFNVDLSTGILGCGSSNASWYKVNNYQHCLASLLQTTKQLFSGAQEGEIQTHPDTGKSEF
jgi:hypothetical protein